MIDRADGRTPASGDVIAGYRLERPVGRGGMAEVWVGRHGISHSVAAVKLLHPEASQEVRALFENERRALLRLFHPNIVSVFDVGDDYIVTAFIEGQDLRHRLRTPMAPMQALAITRILGAALQHAHDAGVVHCDVKPSNVLLDRAETPFLADFGISRLLDDAADADVGVAFGTHNFIAPEQAAGTRPTPAADQYSLARLLAVMLNGAPVDDPLPAIAAIDGIDERIIAPLAQALRPNPDDRFTSMQAFMQALHQVDLDAVSAQTALVAFERDPAPFAWAAHPVSTSAAGGGLVRATYRLSDLEARGVLSTDAIARFRAATHYQELAWSMVAAEARLGPLCSSSALARARDTVVLLHGLFTSRTVWNDVSAGIARDNGLAVVLAPDLMGFGESRFSADAPASAFALTNIVGGMNAWLNLIGLDGVPTVVLGHSLAATALLCARSEVLSRSVHRICLTPVVSGDSRIGRWAMQVNSALAWLAGLLPRALVRPVARMLFAMQRSMRGVRAEVRREMADSAVRLGPRPVARLLSTVASATAAPPEELARCSVVTTPDDALVPRKYVERTIRDSGIPPQRIYNLLYGGHFPQLIDEQRPEWAARNIHELVHLVDQVLDVSRTTGSQEESSSSNDTTIAVPITEAAETSGD